ncbi:DNA repair protein RecO [Candidatus Saccharibacteria bacterium]|nr:DNA repair protein RecO [Candidatus Saccharibacteria bacterium]
MPKNTPKDLKTKALVLRRTNYSEADRILNLITPEGKVSVIAKGVRKPKSKLAGSVEMFTLFEANLHFGRSEMGVLTGASMVRFYGGILKDLDRMSLATFVLKEISKVSENLEAPEFFEIANECLAALDEGMANEVVEAWFLLNLAKAMGEQVNLLTDTDGEDLAADECYDWDANERTFFKNPNGKYDANAIKAVRIMWGMNLEAVRRIKDFGGYAARVLEIAKACYN